jgi:type II secretory pathway pseudopilin PulG
MPRRAEQGYALLSLVAAMTIAMVILASALPSVQHEMQREKEEELFWRARQVAIALGSYQIMYGRPALKLEDLIKPPEIVGQQKGGKTRLRAAALLDPLTNSDWVAIRQGDPRLVKFFQTVQAYLAQEQKIFPPQLLNLIPRAALLPNATGAPTESPDPAEAEADDDSRPIVGIVSRSKKPLIRNYFGIASYDQALILTGVCASPGNCQMLRMPGADQFLDLPLGEQQMNAPRPTLAPPPPPPAPR